MLYQLNRPHPQPHPPPHLAPAKGDRDRCVRASAHIPLQMAALSDRFSNTSGVGQRTYISSLSYESPGGGGAAFCLKEDKRGMT